jgi:carboxymethylenebutenolidase
VIIQEAFGVNRHIRSVADGYAKDGLLAVAPALFDRIERGVELGYDSADLQKGIALARQSNMADAVKDVAAALEYLRKQTARKRGIIGYCFGGTMAWLAATRLDPSAAVGYYGGHIAQFAQENPRCPVILHFGTLDKHIPKEDPSRGADFLVRGGSRVQLRCSRQLQRGVCKTGAGSVAGVPEAAV